MKVYRCHVCKRPSAGKRTPGWYVWLVVSLIAAPFMIGLLMLCFLPAFGRRCTYCNTKLILREVST